MKDERICPHCKGVIDCSKAGYRTLNGHKTSCILNPKMDEKLSKQRFYRKCDPHNRFKKQRVLNCIQCEKEYTILVTDKQFEQNRYKKHCSSLCSNRTTNNKGRVKKTESLRKAYRKGYLKLGKLSESWSRHMAQKGRVGGRKKIRVIVNCLNCSLPIETIPSLKNKIKYCSGTCRNIVNNKIIRGTRSKAEVLLEEFISSTFPNLNYICNDRVILGNNLELDFYFPDIQKAIEWNGIFHYVDVRGDGFLKKRQAADRRKKIVAKEKGIDLLVIKDIKGYPSAIKTHFKTVFDFLKSNF